MSALVSPLVSPVVSRSTAYAETELFSPGPRRHPMRSFDGVDAQLADARSWLDRVSPRAAYQELLYGRGVLVDIRPAAQRAAHGEVAASLAPLVVERNVLEWRFDPRHEARLPQAAFDLRVLVLCQEGYTSSLGAHALQQLGIYRATDVVGGFRAWREAGLPTAAASSS